jgi:hypothetical protein
LLSDPCTAMLVEMSRKSRYAESRTLFGGGE